MRKDCLNAATGASNIPRPEDLACVSLPPGAGLVLAVPALAGTDLSGRYALEGSSSNFAYPARSRSPGKDCVEPSGQPEGGDLQVEWRYENGHKDLGIGVRIGDRLYVA